MNRSKCIHRGTVVRQTTTTGADGKRVPGTLTVATNFRCLVEGMSAQARSSLMGRVQNAAYRVTWFDVEFKDGDVFTWVDRNRDFVLREPLDDTTRPNNPYFTGILQERNS